MLADGGSTSFNQWVSHGKAWKAQGFCGSDAEGLSNGDILDSGIECDEELDVWDSLYGCRSVREINS